MSERTPRIYTDFALPNDVVDVYSGRTKQQPLSNPTAGLRVLTARTDRHNLDGYYPTWNPSSEFVSPSVAFHLENRKKAADELGGNEALNAEMSAFIRRRP